MTVFNQKMKWHSRWSFLAAIPIKLKCVFSFKPALFESFPSHCKDRAWLAARYLHIPHMDAISGRPQLAAYSDE